MIHVVTDALNSLRTNIPIALEDDESLLTCLARSGVEEVTYPCAWPVATVPARLPRLWQCAPLALPSVAG